VTPLSPAAYIVIKMLTSLVLAAGAVAAVYLVGAVTHKVSMPAGLWVITGCCVWIGSLLFAAFGLFAGDLLPTENVAQVLTLVLTLCSFAGGLFIPFSQVSPDLQDFARFTPAVRAQPARPRPADRRHRAMELDREPRRVARHLRDRRHLEPAPRHRQSVTSVRVIEPGGDAPAARVLVSAAGRLAPGGT
jgi:hypothetical protein